MSLKKYVLKRILITIPLFLASTILIFAIIHIAPGNPIDAFFMTNPTGFRQEVKDEMMRQFGFDKPLHIQYINWLKGLLTGDLGQSITTGYSVAESISIRLRNTLKLTLSSWILSLLIAIPVGVMSAVKQNSVTDNLSRAFGIFFYCSPSYWVGILFLLVFSLRLGWFPSYGAKSIDAVNPFLDSLVHLVLPAAVLGLRGSAFQMRLVRSSMIEVLHADYITTARAKGLKEFLVIYKHALRNALIPSITMIGMNIGFLFGGAALVETVFAWPGLGRHAVKMSFARDFTVLMGINAIAAVLVLLGNLIADISYGLLDPRIRY